jgi:hypothetical protein
MEQSLDQSLIFSFESNKSVISISGFEVDLPHLLKLSSSSKLILSLILFTALILGLKFRLVIIRYLCSPEAKSGPINLLYLLEQFNSIFLIIQIVFQIIALNLTFPISEFTGKGRLLKEIEQTS